VSHSGQNVIQLSKKGKKGQDDQPRVLHLPVIIITITITIIRYSAVPSPQERKKEE
jgi:hypothetical protein